MQQLYNNIGITQRVTRRENENLEKNSVLALLNKTDNLKLNSHLKSENLS